MRLGTWFYFHVLMEAFARTLCKSSPDLDLKLDLHLAPGNEKKESDHQHCSKLLQGLVSEYECESSESHPAGMHNSHCPESRFWRCSLPSLQPDAMFSQWHTHTQTDKPKQLFKLVQKSGLNGSHPLLS